MAAAGLIRLYCCRAVCSIVGDNHVQTQDASLARRTEDAATGRLNVVTDCGRYTADRLVLTAGAWIGQLAEPLRVRPL